MFLIKITGRKWFKNINGVHYTVRSFFSGNQTVFGKVGHLIQNDSCMSSIHEKSDESSVGRDIDKDNT